MKRAESENNPNKAKIPSRTNDPPNINDSIVYPKTSTIHPQYYRISTKIASPHKYPL